MKEKSERDSASGSSAGLVRPDSLSDTLDATSEALFYSRPIGAKQRTEVVEWIVGRQGLRGSYNGMSAPTAADVANGARVFTGEPVRSRVSLSHVLGEEACRLLRQLSSENPSAEQAYCRATAEVARRLSELDGKPPGLIGTDLAMPPAARAGVYCCGMCSCALWRHLAVCISDGSISAPEERLREAVRTLRHRRDGEGKWKPFPFWYTLLVLTELHFPEAVEEIRYALPAVERSYGRLRRDDKFSLRRRAVAEKALALA